MSEKLLVPDIGDFENVEVIELLVKEGQEINKNDPIVTIESDKSSVEIPSTLSGIIESIKVKVGDKVSKGDLILKVLESNKKSSASETIPKDTENLIKQAEQALKENDKVDTPLKKKIIEQKKPEIIMNPMAIADAFYYLHTQDRSCWTHELQLTPYSNKPSY